MKNDPKEKTTKSNLDLQHRPKSQRLFFMALGWMVFGLGLIGIFLPLLPTTPFFLLALWFFSKGSEKCHDWLYNHPVFGKYIKIWKEHGVIPRNAKIIAISTMIISAILLVVYSSAPLYATVLAIACMCCAATFILTRPSKASDPSS